MRECLSAEDNLWRVPTTCSAKPLTGVDYQVAVPDALCKRDDPETKGEEDSLGLTENVERGLKQAPNRTEIWSRSQRPRAAAMTGPRFEQTEFDLQPAAKAAIELIHKQPVRWTHERMVACDGGGGPAGHPRVYINTDKPEIATCGYCGLPFISDPASCNLHIPPIALLVGIARPIVLVELQRPCLPIVLRLLERRLPAAQSNAGGTPPKATQNISNAVIQHHPVVLVIAKPHNPCAPPFCPRGTVPGSVSLSLRTPVCLSEPLQPETTTTPASSEKQFTLPARSRGSYLITSEVMEALPEIGQYKIGLLNLFVQHTSCALSLNENWDEDVRADMSDALDRIAPEAHIKSALIGASVTIPIKDGKLATGTWQGIWYLEFRASRHQRRVMATIQGEKA
ncbi:hypothetical protein NPX13_g1540 [Xylaria arbuscula]|uniref:Zinc finger CHCC-type domain-containing protein n=1 Tax=Xylaria arbuscula TaxID=114810 RepID=A0A9W8NLU8_9PEZI|nr:hypothetical protein NPX13_g1540 [Xylaria arbuscula]